MMTKPRQTMPHEPMLTQEEFEALAAFRLELRRYLAFAQEAAEACGITMQQHQALLAIKAARQGSMTVGELADNLFLRHHSTVELADRLAKAGLVARGRDPEDGRKAMLSLTEHGASKLLALASSHVHEISARGPELVASLSRVIEIHGKPAGKSRGSSLASKEMPGNKA